VVWITEVVCEGMAAGEVLVKLWLLQGGVTLHWAGEPAGLSTSMGEASVGGLVDAAAAYKWGAAGVGEAAAAWEAGGLCVHRNGRCILGMFGGRGFGIGSLEGPASSLGPWERGRSSQRHWGCGVKARRGCWWCTGDMSSVLYSQGQN